MEARERASELLVVGLPFGVGIPGALFIFAFWMTVMLLVAVGDGPGCSSVLAVLLFVSSGTNMEDFAVGEAGGDACSAGGRQLSTGEGFCSDWADFAFLFPGGCSVVSCLPCRAFLLRG